jgi:iron complex outermembrane receptor protein
MRIAESSLCPSRSASEASIGPESAGSVAQAVSLELHGATTRPRTRCRGALVTSLLLLAAPLASARAGHTSELCTGIRRGTGCPKHAPLLAQAGLRPGDAATMAPPDPASDAPGAGAQPEPRLAEVIVTAHGFAESNFRLPAVDTAFTAKDLGELRSPNIEGLMDLVPGMAFTQSQQAGLSFISIRGISQNRNTTSPVVTRLDGVNEIDPEQFNQVMFDLSSVQVIKGPEGALYGPDAVAGAIIINTANPTNYYTGYAELNEGDYGQYGGSFGVGGPIVKNVLQFRLAGIYSNNSGFFSNVTLPGFGENPQERWGVRLKLRLLTGKYLQFDLNSSFQRTLGTANFYHYEPALVTPAGKLAPGPDPFNFSLVNANTVSYTFYNNYPGLDDYKLDQQSFKATYRGLPFARIRSTTSYTYLTELTEAKAFPYTGSLSSNTVIGNVDGAQTQYFNIRGWTEELRMTSTRSATAPGLHWLAGLYYSYVNRFISSTTSQDLGRGIIPIYYVPQPNSSINPTDTFFADDNHNFTRSVLGSVGYQLPYHVGIDIADRWDEVKANQFVSPLQIGGGVPGAVNRARFIRNSPRVTLQWLPMRNLSLYATWGEGMRAGGFNQNGTGATAALLGLKGVGDRIKAEVTRTTELGFKSRWLDDRLQVNGDAYAIHDSNQPFFVFVGQVGAQILININRARMYGGDLDVRGIVFSSPSFGKLTAYASGSYNHNFITRYSLNPADVGNMLPQAPRWLWNAGFQYERHLFDVRDDLFGPVSLFTRWDLAGRTKEAWDADNSSLQGGYSTLNVRFGLRGRRMSVMASILNATNKRYNEEFVEGGFTEPALPRTAMVTVTMKFGE